MPKLALLPLDNRPPTAIFPQRLAAIAGIDLVSPPPELLGNFLQPGDPESLGAWLEEVASSVDAILLATDMLAYGGLVASRTTSTSLIKALDRLAVLRKIKQRNPQVALLAASVIMRISVTASDRGTASIYHAIIRYSELSYLVEQEGRTDLLSDYEELKRRIPSAALEAYLSARARNHAVNRLTIDLLADHILDGLILTQEDASLKGPHLLEQQQLRAWAKERGIEGQALIYPGADEGTQTLLARWINHARPVQVQMMVSSDQGAGETAPYEDRPVRKTVQGHLAAAGCQAVEESSEAILWVHTRCNPQERAAAAQAITAQVRAGKPVFLADVCYPNGSDPELMDTLRDLGALPGLAGYAAWNTAGNSIGTAVATLSAWGFASHANLSTGWSQARFLWERQVDDWGYQRVVREEIEMELARQAIDPLNLGVHKAAVELKVRQRLIQWAAQLWVAGGWAGQPPQLAVFLPWPRTFEVMVEAQY